MLFSGFVCILFGNVDLTEVSYVIQIVFNDQQDRLMAHLKARDEVAKAEIKGQNGSTEAPAPSYK